LNVNTEVGGDVKSILESLIVIVLVLAGIAGLSYNAVRQDGYVDGLIGTLWQLETQYPIVAIPATVAGVVLFNVWRDPVARGRKSRLPDLFVYVLMAFGAYYIAQFTISGTI
jgi:hypothetical protein